MIVAGERGEAVGHEMFIVPVRITDLFAGVLLGLFFGLFDVDVVRSGSSDRWDADAKDAHHQQHNSDRTHRVGNVM